MPDGSTLGWPGRVAVAILREDPPRVFVAKSDHALSRGLALHLVAGTAPQFIADRRALDSIREALLEERWSDALVAWIEATGAVLDVYPDEEVWSDEPSDPERVGLVIGVAPIFDDAPGASSS